MARPAVFLDRDGTLHRELERAPRHPREIELFEGVPEALAKLVRVGFALVVVSNQSAIARGELGFDELREVNEWIGAKLAHAGAPIERFYVCPHHPSEGFAPYRRECTCRKPAPGLFQRAIAELDLDPARSWMIGDAERDFRAAHAVGVRTILVRTGKGERELERLRGDMARFLEEEPVRPERSATGLVNLLAPSGSPSRFVAVKKDLAEAASEIFVATWPNAAPRE